MVHRLTPMGSEKLSKSPFGAFRQFFCSLRRIFVQVHAPAENGFHFIRRRSGELCEAVLYT